MLLASFQNYAAPGPSFNGIPADPNYTPPIPADNVVQTLTPFEIVRKSTLKTTYKPAFKGVLAIGPNATTINIKVNGVAFGTALASTNVTVSGSDVTSTAANGNVHFGASGGVLKSGDIIEITGFPATGTITLYLLEKQDLTTIGNSNGLAISLTDKTAFQMQRFNGGGEPIAAFVSTLSALNAGDKLVVKITAVGVEMLRNTANVVTHDLKYKVRLLNEAGTGVSTDAGSVTLSDDSAYSGGLVAANTELKYVVGDVLGGYNVEIESELGRKVLQKIIVVDTPSPGLSGGILSDFFPSNSVATVSNINTPPASWWNRNKTYLLAGGAFLAFALIGSLIINRLSK